MYPILLFGFNTSFKILDRGFLELLGPYGLTSLFLNLKIQLQILQSGQITHYIFFIIISLCLLINDFLNLKTLFYFCCLIFFI